MRKLGRKQLTVHLVKPLEAVPPGLAQWAPTLANGGRDLEYAFSALDENTGIPGLLKRLSELGLEYADLNTRQSSLEDIFVSLVHRNGTEHAA
jgi:ABC-2 type transport system ATP-binding protein